MKRIFGLDLGTNSIGWAVVNEKENENESSSIVRLGVKSIPLTTDEQQDFEKGKTITTNAVRTAARSARRNLQRYKLRRKCLLDILKANGFISDETVLAEKGNHTTFETFRLRSKAPQERITLEELARVLLMLNKKRGYKSNRKVVDKDEGKAIDGMDVAKALYEQGLTPGQYSYNLLEQGRNVMPDYYKSDLENEFDLIWNMQQTFYPDLLTEGLRDELKGKNEKQTWAISAKALSLEGVKHKLKGKELIKEIYRWRVKSLSEKVELEELAVVLQKLNGQINSSGSYLGMIGDRSKRLHFNNQTVGQYKMEMLEKNPNRSLKNMVFYRQDYLDEFEKIWETQSKYHKELTQELKSEIRDIVIFYQRPLKSQKGLVSFCELESEQREITKDGKTKTVTVGARVCPKSSPLFQEFKIWQILNNVQVSGPVIDVSHTDLFGTTAATKYGKRFLSIEEKELLFKELSLKDKLSKAEALKFLYKTTKGFDLNYKELDGNRTMVRLLDAYRQVIDMSGHGDHDFSKMPSDKILEIIKPVFEMLGIDIRILDFNSSLEKKELERQPSYMLWHLLYSFAGDNSESGNESLINKISQKYGFPPEYARVIANVSFESDYGSLSAKAIRKILPYMKEGTEYSLACEYAGYRHSKSSLKKDEIENKVLKDKLELLPRNSLRNPVVEKILNQMVNLINSLASEYGKPDEIRIEMARELKKSAKEREDTSKAISQNTKEQEEYKKILETDFGIKNVTRNDIIRYRLYLELKENGFKTLYSDTYIPREKLFSKDFDIEHIIPQARLFDDSFSNKTLEARSVNIDKRDMTALDYVHSKGGDDGLETYKKRIEALLEKGCISKTKCSKLLMSETDIPDGFIDRDLRNTQYIAKKALEILGSYVRVVVPTIGSVTDRLRDDWQLVDVMKELNWSKYDKLGLTYIVEDRDGRKIRKIKDWTKRNDQRHHAMDALTIAFTKHSYIQYLNNMNARSKKSGSIYAIELKELYRDSSNKLRFIPPMPLDIFRAEAKRHLENILVSFKGKNKVVTSNVNVIKVKGGQKRKVQLTPRGQLHNETIYKRMRVYVSKEEKVGSSFTEEKIKTVAKASYREALLKRLQMCKGDAKKAFTGKNSLDKNPIFLNELHTERVPMKVKTVTLEEIYTIRKEINSDLKLDKVIDVHIREILKKRLEEYGGDAKKAFSNLDENPIWLNKEKGIQIKKVAIKALNNAVALHDKRDNEGKLVLDKDGKKQPSDFVNPGNNHHIAIFRDPEGRLQEHVVPFFEAVESARMGWPALNKNYNNALGWEFLFAMRQNDYFVFPDKESGFDPNEMDLLNPDNYAEISKHLFRVQKLSTRNYVFRHHLETKVDENKNLRDMTWKRIQTVDYLKGVVKVRVNNIGRIVFVGEYL